MTGATQVFLQTYDYTGGGSHGATEQLTSACTTYNGADTFCQQYVYDMAGRLQEYRRLLSPSGVPVHPMVGWDWDARGNPTSVTPGVGAGNISFGYATSPRVDEVNSRRGRHQGHSCGRTISTTSMAGRRRWRGPSTRRANRVG